MSPIAALGRAALRTGLALVVLAASGLQAQEPLSWGRMQEALQEVQPSSAATIPYGPGANRYGELALPSGTGNHPVAIVIHGGCWLSMADLSYMRPLAQELNRAGWATWSLEFNRIDEDEGSWPGILNDVARGVDHLRELDGEYPLDLRRVVVVGHSSGGHLALWAASRRGLGTEGPVGGTPLPVHGIVGLAPITSLEDFQRRSDRCGSGIVANLLDAEPEATLPGPDNSTWAARLHATDPARLLPLGVPQLLLMGELDGIVPPEHGRAWRRAARDRGDDVEFVVIPGAGHFELVAPWTAPWDRVQEELEEFLRGLKSGA